ncbi:hypothetical protein CY34DRAFT_627535 [Suillus luteus UH-Slu-Lm8-n1]|uniref:Uncharacterized protein n=1 Tax=Suillus luteus UH-Slu-Lm8-n1 TaxID=930992 RepID=A0A0D0C0Z2_9AGAM|nr:hypothetical protein CY34DRAFT_627535 [Suillus luteus UH-Slu-Lm8-n1]
MCEQFLALGAALRTIYIHTHTPPLPVHCALNPSVRHICFTLAMAAGCCELGFGEGGDIRRVLYPRLFWEHPLQRCAVNSCIRLSNTTRVSVGMCLFSLRKRNIVNIRLWVAATNGPPG